MPRTGTQYIESLRDGREVYILGERVTDVTTHPGLAGGALSAAHRLAFAAAAALADAKR